MWCGRLWPANGLSARYTISGPIVLSAPAGRNRAGEQRVLCYQYGGESESGLAPMSSANNWRCIAVEKLQSVELREDSWRTAPNHSRPAHCIVDVDIDVDQPGRGPQNGQ